MGVHISETIVDSHGRVILDHLPFEPGEKVDVVIRSHKPPYGDRSDLIGSVLRYENPFEPVALEDGQPRRLGWAQGEFTVPGDFDAPLPPEIEDRFYQGNPSSAA